MITIPKPDKEPSDFKSRRPLTLLPVLGKGLERVLLERLWHLRSDWFDKSQHGFMKASRTETALFSLSNYLERNASGSTAVAALQLDFSLRLCFLEGLA